MELFSQRNGISPRIVQPDEMPDGLKNRLWNEIENIINRSYERNRLIPDIWSNFLKKSNSDLNGTTSYR